MSAKAADAEARKEEALIKRLLRTETAEALEWLRGGGRKAIRTLGELPTRRESIALVRRLYRAGAVEVIAADIDEYPEGQNTGKLVLNLPAAKARRKAVFEICAALIEERGFDPVPDRGQPRILLLLD